MYVANLCLSPSLYCLFGAFASVQGPRTSVDQLDPTAISCRTVSKCDSVAGLLLENGSAVQEEIAEEQSGSRLIMEFSNPLQLPSER